MNKLKDSDHIIQNSDIIGIIIDYNRFNQKILIRPFSIRKFQLM